MNAATYRARFLDDAVLSASPVRLLIMLYDRLVLDLDRAEQAQRAGDRAAAAEQLTHAQDIIGELMSSLDHDAWDGAAGLHALYTFALNQLIEANISGDAEPIAAARGVVQPLRDTWNEAATTLAAEQARQTAQVRAAASSGPAFAAGAVGGSLGELGVG